MRRRVGHIEIDTIAAERSKFTAPMVLIHGLWCTSKVWHRFMGYLAHRGWDCHAVNLRGRSNEPTTAKISPATLADHHDDLNGVIAACDSPPVVVGHDLGALLALSSALAPIRAAVAIAPLLPRPWRNTPIPGLTSLHARFAARWRDELPPPRGALLRDYFGTTPPQPLVPESAALRRDLCASALSFPLGTAAPVLVVSGDADPVTPLDAVAGLAQKIGAELRQIAKGGHALPWEVGWQERVTEIHRWLILALGDPLLIPEEEESD